MSSATEGRAQRPTPPRAAPGPLIRWIHKRRPLLTFLFVLALLAVALLDGRPPADLLRPRADPLFWIPWALVLLGTGVRVWGSGNLRKNQEITRTGVYRIVRHPLYLGSLSVFLAFFLTLVHPAVGAALWLAMVLLVYYPTMVDEEAWLAREYPEQTGSYAHLPRLVPDLPRLPEALRTDRFTLRAAWSNLGLRSLWALPALPAVLELLRWVEGAR